MMDSKPSESELGILIHFPNENKQQKCKDLLCCFSSNPSYGRHTDQEQGSSKEPNGMMRVES